MITIDISDESIMVIIYFIIFSIIFGSLIVRIDQACYLRKRRRKEKEELVQIGDVDDLEEAYGDYEEKEE